MAAAETFAWPPEEPARASFCAPVVARLTDIQKEETEE